MSVNVLVIYGLVGLGALLLALRVALLFGLALNHNAFNVQIAKLCRARNRARAIKLCGAVPRVPYAAALRTTLRGLDGLDSYGGAEGLREGVRRVFAVALATHSAGPLRLQRVLGVLGVMAITAGVGLSAHFGGPLHQGVWIAVALGVGALLWGSSVVKGIRSGPALLEMVLDDIVEPLEAELAEKAQAGGRERSRAAEERSRRVEARSRRDEENSRQAEERSRWAEARSAEPTGDDQSAAPPPAPPRASTDDEGWPSLDWPSSDSKLWKKD